MNLVCLIYVACVTLSSPGSSESKTLSCTILRSECMNVTPEQEAAASKQCEAASNCIEPKKGFFVIRKSVPAVVETRI